MPEVKVKDLNAISTPLVCRDKDDFTKLFLAVAMTMAEGRHGETDKDAVGFNIESLRILLHEYLALVFKGRLEPYNIKFASEQDQEESINMFRESMLLISERLMESGVPMQETDDGRTSIMFDKLKEMGEKEFEDGENEE